MPRILDFAFAAAIAGWAVAGAGERSGAVAVALLGVQLCVAALLCVRRAEVAAAPWSALALASPAVVAGAVVLGAAPDPALWPAPSTALFCAGAALTVGALCSLGRSFAVLPGLRAVVVRGPYRVVRHPAYLGEALMVAAAAAARADLAGVSLLALAVALLIVRIRAEESVLAVAPAWQSYRARVRTRLIPGLW